MNPPSRMTLLAVAAAAACLPALAQVNRNDPATWVWNVPDRPEIRGVTHHVLRSASMHLDVGYNVALPAGYEGGNARYPVIYFLHGRGGNENSDAGGFSSMVRGAVNAGTMPPAICVFPNGSLSFYLDDPERQVFGETLIVNELVPEVDRRYRTIAAGRGRALAGFSMGGAGAVRLALKYPDTFLGGASWGGALDRAGGETGTLLAESAAHFREHGRSLLLIVGEKDSRAAHEAFVARLKELGVDHQYVMLPGVPHNLGQYYEKSADMLLEFLAKALRGAGG